MFMRIAYLRADFRYFISSATLNNFTREKVNQNAVELNTSIGQIRLGQIRRHIGIMLEQ